MINVQNYSSFSSANTAPPTLTFNSQGQVTNQWSYNTGSANDIARCAGDVSMADRVRGPLGFDLANLPNGSRLLVFVNRRVQGMSLTDDGCSHVFGAADRPPPALSRPARPSRRSNLRSFFPSWSRFISVASKSPQGWRSSSSRCLPPARWPALLPLHHHRHANDEQHPQCRIYFAQSLSHSGDER